MNIIDYMFFGVVSASKVSIILKQQKNATDQATYAMNKFKRALHAQKVRTRKQTK